MSLWDTTYGEMGATLKALEKFGVDGTAFARIRKDESVANQVAGILKIPAKPRDLLGPAETISLPAGGPLDAGFFFVLNQKADNGLTQISYLWDDFKQWFLTKREPAIGPTRLDYQPLLDAGRSDQILAALGGEEKAETSLSLLVELLLGQKNGQSGILLTNGYANIFFIKDANGVLRAVRVDWGVDGWFVYAYPVDRPDTWRAGYRVFSRNSGKNAQVPLVLDPL